MGYVYHGSTVPNLTVLKPNISSHRKEYVYASPSEVVATIFLSDGGSDLCYYLSGNGINRPLNLVERKDGIFRQIFNVSGYIYTLDDANFKSGLTSWSAEVVSEQEEKVIAVRYIENVYDELLKLSAERKLNLYLYPNRPEQVPLDNSDLIPMVINWHDYGFDLQKFIDLYPELEEQLNETMREAKKSK